jgi:pyruvate dehydrogenase E2 component (dihydrolipoamide acetyltransferase)
MGALLKLLMPKLGLTMTEGTVTEWPVAEGVSFSSGQVFVVVETDKVANEIEAPADGRLRRILVQTGETVTVGTPIAEWEAEAAPAAAAHAAPVPAAIAAQALRRSPSAAEATAARRLTESKQRIPHFYLSTEIDVGSLQRQRAQWNQSAAPAKATLTHLFVLAMARTLAAHPELNCVWDEEGYLHLPGIDIGIAVNTEQGLLVPVLKHADAMDLAQVVTKASELVSRARRGALLPGDVGGGMVTISNAGMFDVTYMAPIINPGQAAILGVGSQRAVFRPDAGGAPRLVHEVGAVLSCDHRVLDGVKGLKFLNGVRGRLESPEALFA